MNAHELGLDYYKIYDVVDHRVEHWVTLQGQFDEEPEKAELLLMSHFANPASKIPEEKVDSNAHLSWYWLYQPMPEPMRVVVVETSPGVVTKLVIGRPVALLAPAQKKERGSRFPKERDHFKVYRVLRGEPLQDVVELEDQFGSEPAEILYPVAFGVPVQKEYKGEVSPINNDRAHLLIQRIVPRPVQQRKIVRDQFGRRYVSFLRSVGLAVPCVKHKWQDLE
jgi:hypothetical protein